MIKSLEINNYRNLSNLKINSLGNVNLITGKNNTGKSTLLEAIIILASKGDLKTIMELLTERGEYFRHVDNSKNIESSLNILSSLFNNRKISFQENDLILIQNKITNIKEFVTIKFVKYIEQDEDEFTRKRIVLDNENDDFNAKIGLQIVSDLNSRILPLSDGLNRFERLYSLKTNDFANRIQYVKTRNINRDLNSKLWDAITLTEKEKYVIDAIKIIEPTTEGITYKEVSRNERIPFIKLSDSNLIFPLQSMGDGINRILTIILSLVNSENGYFLIDEIENGLHHSVQEKLWEIIFNLSEKLNIQVFATTHSEDTIKSFENILNGNQNKIEGKLIRLENKNGKINQIEFNSNDLRIATDNNIEIR